MSNLDRRTTLEKWCDGTEWCARAKWYVKELLVPCLYPEEAAMDGVSDKDMVAMVDTAVEAVEGEVAASAGEDESDDVHAAWKVLKKGKSSSSEEALKALETIGREV